MKIALVDDDPKCLDEMACLCRDFGTEHCCQIETVPFCAGEDFLAAFGGGGYSVVFMDIYMGKMDGITAALRMRSMDNACLLVFLTSSRDFMPDAFSCHAFEYITKPFSKERVAQVLSDALSMLPSSRKYIEITNAKKTVRIFLDEIVSVLSDAHYLDITLFGQKNLRCRMTMSEFTVQTGEDERFIPINKGITVNADYILELKENCCILENSTKFPIRVRDGRKIEQAVLDYNFAKIRRQQTGCGKTRGACPPGKVGRS